MSEVQTVHAAHLVRCYAMAARLAAGSSLAAMVARIREEVGR